MPFQVDLFDTSCLVQKRGQYLTLKFLLTTLAYYAPGLSKDFYGVICSVRQEFLVDPVSIFLASTSPS